MRANMYFSPGQNVFLDGALYDTYVAAGSWPEDAIEADEETWLKYGASQPEAGTYRSSDDNGMPCWVKAELEPAHIRRTGAINWLDATADRVRASDRSVGRYLDAEYQLVAQALIEYRNNPEGEVPDAIQSYAAAEGLTVEAAAQQIAESAARVQELLQDVRRIRLAGKAAIREATDDADMMETARPFIDRLEELAGAE